MKTITKIIREERRKAAEIRQAAEATRPLKEKVAGAGAKELAKLIDRFGAEEIKKLQN